MKRCNITFWLYSVVIIRDDQKAPTYVASTYPLLLSSFGCDVPVHRTYAIDPDYEIDKRFHLIIDAIRNTIEDTQVHHTQKPLKSLVTFWCASSNNTQRRQVITNDPHLHAKLNMNLPLAFLIHGWTENIDLHWIQDTMSEYTKHTASNICAVDWTRLALTEYTIAAGNTKHVAKYLLNFIAFLRLQGGLKLEQVTIVGHSFGAQIAGLVGGKLQGQIARIIGLDPAGWLFTKPTPVATRHRLDHTDAKFVQCMHTNADYIGLGASMDCGHQDYYPNDGLSPQPGCLRPSAKSGLTYLPLTCSHYKSVQYFLASLNPNNKYIGWKCLQGYYWWSIGMCQSETFDYFGIYAMQSTQGQLYLKTLPYPPFVRN